MKSEIGTIRRKKSIPNPNRKILVSSSYCWKVLGSLVEDLKDYLSIDDIYVIKNIIRRRDFPSYLELESHWGLQSMIPVTRLDDFQKMKARYAIVSLLKKFCFDTSNTEVQDEVARKAFLVSEKSCKFYNAFGIKELLAGKDAFTVEILTYARSFLQKLLGETVPVKDVIEKAKHGPGANLDTCFGASMYDKYLNLPYSCTRDCISYATFMIQSDERWFRALVDWYRREKHLSSTDHIDASRVLDYAVTVVDCNRISFVPKNAKTSRSIAIEPALNIMLQLGVDKVIRSRLKRWGIDLDNQEHNRRLARSGSITGDLSTIDLKAASDTVSLSICEALLPSDWYHFLLKLRSPKGNLGGDTISYEKMSSMGNGYTFVLESALFAAIIFAVYKVNSAKANFSENCAVFGDDLIVETRYFEQTVHALKLCGFKTNTEKSFSKGFVRESCGTDWFKGRPLRPIYLDSTPENVQELYVHHNLLKRYFDLRFGNKTPESCRTISKWIPNDLVYWGPPSDEVYDSWLHTFVAPKISKDGLFRFTRLLRFPATRVLSKAYKYGHWHFHLLSHDLKPVGGKPFFEKFKSLGKTNGSRFDVKDKIFTTRQQSSVASFWPAEYQGISHLIPCEG